MECFNDDRIPNRCDYSYFGHEDSTVTATKYNADIYHDYHYKDFSNESFDYYNPDDQLRTHSAYITPQLDLPTLTKSPRNIWVRKSKLPVQPVHCDVCDCNLNSSAQAEAHFKGQSHQKRLNKIRVVDPAFMSLNHDTDMREIVTEGYSSFESSETSILTDKTATVGVDEKLERQASVASLLDASCPQDHDEFRITEPPKKKQKVVLAIPCEICGLTFNSQGQAGDHFSSLKHIKKINWSQQVNVIDLLRQEVRPNPPGKFHCSVCNISLNSSLQLDQHCSGQGHKKKLLNYAAPENEVSGHKSGWFYCRICDVSCRTALGLQKHVLSENHKTKTQAEAEPKTPAETQIDAEVEVESLAETEGEPPAESEAEAPDETQPKSPADAETEAKTRAELGADVQDS